MQSCSVKCLEVDSKSNANIGSYMYFLTATVFWSDKRQVNSYKQLHFRSYYFKMVLLALTIVTYKRQLGP